MNYAIDPDIAVAETLPGSFYSDTDAFMRLKNDVFARSWQWIGTLDDVASPQRLSPRQRGRPPRSAQPGSGR